MRRATRAAAVLALLAVAIGTSASAQVCSGRNQSCGAKPCCVGLTCVSGTCRTVSVPTTTTTTLGGGVTTTTQHPVPMVWRPPADAVDLSIVLNKPELRCRWVQGRPANQAERSGLYEAMLFAKYHPQCAQAMKTCGTFLELEYMRLFVYYVSEDRNSQWQLLTGCGDYSHVLDCGQALHACATGTTRAAVDCAASPWMTTDLLTCADLRVEQGQCVSGASRRPLIPTGKDPLNVVTAGALDFTVPLPPVSAASNAALDALVSTHHAVDAASCAGHTMAGVKAAAARLYATAADARQAHAFVLDFTSAMDRGPTGWKDQPACDWKMLQGIAMRRWRDCFRRPVAEQWACAVTERTRHATLHRCGAVRDEHRVRIDDGGRIQLTSQPARTCEEWLACQTGETPGCRLPWVPDGWRTVVAP